MKNFSQRLKELRNERKQTQADMAERLGLKIRAYQYYESGDHYPEVLDLMNLADYFDVTNDYLLGRTDQRA